MEGKCALVVYGHSSTTALTAKMLQHLGYDIVHESHSMEDTAALFEQHQSSLSLLILDAMLPISRQDYDELQPLLAEREAAYTTWLATTPDAPDDDEKASRAMWNVQSLDEIILSKQDIEAGVQLTENLGRIFGHNGRLSIPVVITTTYGYHLGIHSKPWVRAKSAVFEGGFQLLGAPFDTDLLRRTLLELESRRPA